MPNRTTLNTTKTEHNQNAIGLWGVGAEREARGVAECRMRSGKMLPTLVVGWRASVLRGEEAGCFPKVDGVSIVAAGGPRSR